jgi:hypothetical protein
VPYVDKSNRVHAVNRRLKEFDNYKKTLKCMDCGLQDHRVLEFHHRDPKDVYRKNGKRVALKTLVRLCHTAKMNNYLEACDVVCANCHMIRHYEERNEAVD